MRVDEELAVEMLQLVADVGAIDADLHAEKCLWNDNFVEGLRPVYAKRKQDLPVRPSFRDGNPSKEELSFNPGRKPHKGKESKGEERESTSYSCPELSEPDTSEPVEEQVTPPVELSPEVLRIPLIQRDGEFIVRQEDVDQWSDTFPGVDVPGELKRIRQWNLDNPKKRKTKAGIRGHISTWLGKAQNSGSYQSPRGTPPVPMDNRPRPTTVAQAVTLQNAELAKNLRVCVGNEEEGQVDREQLTSRITEELAAWKLRDRWYASYTVEEIQFLAEEYADDLWGEIYLRGLEKTLQHVRRHNKGFPSVSDIIEADRMVNRAELIGSDQLSLPEFTGTSDLTPEEVERNKRRVEINRDVALRRISWEEGERLQKELLKENEFKGRMVV